MQGKFPFNISTLVGRLPWRKRICRVVMDTLSELYVARFVLWTFIVQRILTANHHPSHCMLDLFLNRLVDNAVKWKQAAARSLSDWGVWGGHAVVPCGAGATSH